MERDFSSLWQYAARLLRSNPGAARLANPYLHILNLSDKARKRYSRYLDNKSTLPLYVAQGLKAVAAIIRAAAQRRSMASIQGEPLATNARPIVFVSHLVSDSQLQHRHDPYFGSLPDEIAHAVVLMIDHRNGRRPVAHGSVKAPHYINAMIPGLITGAALFFDQGRDALMLVLKSIGKRDKTEARFYRHAAAYAISSPALANRYIAKQILQQVKWLDPATLILTYEGHGWERLVIKGISQRHKTLVIGYCHQPLLPGGRAINHKIGHGADPDYIMVTGQAARKTMMEESDYRAGQIIVLGSARYAGSVPAEKAAKAGADFKGQVLIAPEGVRSEIETLVEAGMALARLMPEQTVAIRMHPVVSLALLRRWMPSVVTAPANCIFSTASSDEDIKRASWLIYRGSTMVYQAIQHGVRPIFYNPDGASVFTDPLPDRLAWKKCAHDIASLRSIIKHDKENPVRTGQTEAINYALSVFEPLNPAALRRLAER